MNRRPTRIGDSAYCSIGPEGSLAQCERTVSVGDNRSAAIGRWNKRTGWCRRYGRNAICCAGKHDKQMRYTNTRFLKNDAPRNSVHNSLRLTRFSERLRFHQRYEVVVIYDMETFQTDIKAPQSLDLCTARLGAVFPLPGGPSRRIGLFSFEARKTMVAVISSLMYPILSRPAKTCGKDRNSGRSWIQSLPRNRSAA